MVTRENESDPNHFFLSRKVTELSLLVYRAEHDSFPALNGSMQSL